MELRPPQGDASIPQLVELIADEIHRKGPITFARFMELAVGHPDFGYYASSVERVGPSGDFLTAPETHPLFGWLAARQIAECWMILGSEPELRICEEGAGRGTLATQILDALSSMTLEGLQTVRYVLNDLNPDHADDVERRIGQASGTLDLTLGPVSGAPFTGVVIANELLDALPFHRLVKTGREVRELWVTLEDGWFVARPDALSVEAQTFAVDADALQDGQIIEVAPTITGWIHELDASLERGFAILFDYGYERDVLYDTNRFPRGTLKTYRSHDVGEDPFLDIGQRDITAHVDFTLVRESAVETGLTLEGITSLAEFSAGVGLDEILMEIQSNADSAEVYLAARTAAMELLNPAGLGRFRVAIISKGVTINRDLKGLSFRMPGL